MASSAKSPQKKAKKQTTSGGVFRKFQATSTDSLIVRQSYGGTPGLAFCYSEAADRLADTYTGQPIDDTILLPYLFLYRHAIELRLKDLILRGRRLNQLSKGCSVESSEEIRRDLQQRISHNLAGLLDELNPILDDLGVPPVSGDARNTIVNLSQNDPGGMSFRYMDAAAPGSDHVDFTRLREGLGRALETVTMLDDFLDAAAEPILEFAADMNEEWSAIEAEIRSSLQ